MTTSLRNYICSMGMLLCALTPSFSQVPGNPRLDKAIIPKSTTGKSSSRLSPDLRKLVLQSKSADITNLAKPSSGDIGNGLENLIQLYNGKVVIDATIAGDQAQARLQLEKAGAKITGTFGRIISALIPIESLPKLEEATQLQFVKPAYKPRHQNWPQLKNELSEKKFYQSAPMQTVYSQGDTAQGSYIARNKYKANGKGVKIGILSDSYNNLGGAETGELNGELPGPKNPYNYKKQVTVLSDMDSGGIDEGRAMAEIVHDVAPGAEIAFHTADFGQAAFAQGIVNLADVGCKIIVDDIYYYAEPYFQDGIIAQAIDKVVKKGTTYFTAAGNSSNRSYEMNYKPSDYQPLGPGWGTAHNFAAPGAQPIYFQPVFIPTNGIFTIGFQWDDPFYSAGGLGAESDLDMFLFDDQGNLIARSIYNNIGNDPFEFLGLYNNSPNTTFYISLVKYAGPNPSRLKYVMFDDGSFYSNVPIPGQFAPAIIGHSNSEGAISTAAAWYKSTPAYGLDLPLIEGFSSLGGTMIYFDKEGIRIPAILRKKPDITAPDGGNTSFFYRDDAGDTDVFPNFYGTSAAAPHAAAAAALMIDAQKLNTLTPSQIRGIMAAKTYDMDNRFAAGFEKGFDYNTGMGLIRADLSIGEVKFPNLYIKNLELVAMCSEDPGKTSNWKIVNPNPFEVKVHWFLTGFGQDTKSTVPPGDTYFSTQTGYYRNRQVPNVVILDWEDNFGFTRFDLASAATNECKNDVAGTQVLSAGDKAALVKERPLKPEIADVFPNPSRSQFKLYLSLNNPGKADISLFTESGKLLYRNNVSGSGIYDIDASNYKPGLYLMKISQGSFTRTLKLIKQ
jgi:hypothetical protein